jgi:lipoprotein-anchoring transpeptidase ErfK/SrfK
VRAVAGALACAAALALAAGTAAADEPGVPTRTNAWIANLVAATPAFKHPRAVGKPRRLRPLGVWTGGPVGLLVLKARDDWVKVLLPNRPNRAAAWVQADRVRLVRTRWRVRIDVSRRRVTVLRNGRVKRRFGAVVGAPGTPTPTGDFAVYEVARQADPGGFLGPVALHLTAHSDVLDNYGGGPGRVAIHGRGGASLQVPLGSAASHGCVRVDSRKARWLARKLQPGAPVTIVE